MKDFVVVSVMTLPHQLAIMRALLEDEGISTLTKDENIVQVHNFRSNAVGGVKLLVHKEQYEIARSILKSYNYPTVEPLKLNWGERVLGKILNFFTFKK